ncbi:hypothetical protein [uncultured Psychrobacter sp.]|uniref:hypothetical protein n=1 Tax=uncultured Psychrobacter sp. TaxID=259303 RepID=UPI00345864B4
MNNKLTGSDLTRTMLARGDTNIWCAVDDDSDDQAMTDHENNDFTARIVSFKDGHFICTMGATWLYAVPIKIAPLTQEDAGL